MQLNYIIIAHKDPRHLARLLFSLQSPNSHFYICVDAKCDFRPFQEALKACANVHWVLGRIRVRWGNISQVQASLSAIKEILKHRRTGYCILMSGQDYPLKSTAQIEGFFRSRAGTNFIDAQPAKIAWPSSQFRLRKYNYHLFDRYRVCYSVESIHSWRFWAPVNLYSLFCVLVIGGKWSVLKQILYRRKHPAYLKAYGGSSWWALPVSTVSKISGFLAKHPDFIEYHRYTHSPDEIIYSSLVQHLEDDAQIDRSVTYVNWDRQGCKLPVTFHEAGEIDELMDSGCLFARKFEGGAPILDEIDKHLDNRQPDHRTARGN